MSIKGKLALLISLIVTVSLTLNISIYYISSESELRSNAEQQMLTIAKQLGAALEFTEKSKQYIEERLSEMLRNAAIAAQNELDPHIDHVKNEHLVVLSRKLGVDHITLWARTENDIVALKSSEPQKINLSSKTWDYWHTAFVQLFEEKQVDVPQGQKLPNFWAGPIQYSTSDSDRIYKWGYYYDGTTDYIINPYIDAKPFLQIMRQNSADELIGQLMASNPSIVGITGFDPAYFGQPPVDRDNIGLGVRHLDIYEIPFGTYEYRNGAHDVEHVRKAAESGESVTTVFSRDGKHILQSFIPLDSTPPYVVGVMFDYESIMRTLNWQLMQMTAISLGLIIAASIASYFLSGILIRPLQQILRHVDEIAQGRFGNVTLLESRDEFGLLAAHINTMANNLRMYTNQLKDTAEELRGTKEFLESFVGQTSDAIHVTDLEGRVTSVNQAFEKMFGWQEHEVKGRQLSHVSESKRQESEELRRRILRGESVADYETQRLTKNGDAVDVSITVSPIRDADGNITAIAEIARNITARKHAEEAVRRSEKLSVIGQLAAGVAHEIRNPLTTVRGFIQLQRQTGKSVDSHIEVMLSELDRINQIVSEFLVLAKPQAVQYQEIHPKTLITDIILLLEPLAHMNNVQVFTQFSRDVPALLCDPNQLKQVFINIMKNSVEAMPDGGAITIEVGYEPEDRQVKVIVKDEGCGIPEEEMPRLGEPFFTSKSSGNGLGLMVSQRIIANHRGSMTIRSKQGEGTVVEIRLPLPDASA